MSPHIQRLNTLTKTVLVDNSVTLYFDSLDRPSVTRPTYHTNYLLMRNCLLRGQLGFRVRLGNVRAKVKLGLKVNG